MSKLEEIQAWPYPSALDRFIEEIQAKIPEAYEASEGSGESIIMDWLADLLSDDICLVLRARGEGKKFIYMIEHRVTSADLDNAAEHHAIQQHAPGVALRATIRP